MTSFGEQWDRALARRGHPVLAILLLILVMGTAAALLALLWAHLHGIDPTTLLPH